MGVVLECVLLFEMCAIKMKESGRGVGLPLYSGGYALVDEDEKQKCAGWDSRKLMTVEREVPLRRTR